MSYAKFIVSWIIIATISSITTYAWNNQSISEMVEQNNREALITCLTKARTEKTAEEILQATSYCNSHLFTTVSSPLISTGYLSTWTVNTAPISSEPLWFQLIPKVSAKEEWKNVIDVQEKPITMLKYGNDDKSLKQSVTNVNLNKNKKTEDWVIEKIRTPEQIFEQVKHLGYREEPTISLIRSCKDWSIDPRHCIVVGLMLMYNESGNMQNSKACITRNNCFGVHSGKKLYSSLSEGTDNWVSKYNLYWYKAKWASFFYSSAGNTSPSRYCTSEDSSNSSVGCPRWLAIATKKWNDLYPIIY
jgi:hypothetical protein